MMNHTPFMHQILRKSITYSDEIHSDTNYILYPIIANTNYSIINQ